MNETDDISVIWDDERSIEERLRAAREALERQPDSVEILCAYGDLIQLSDGDDALSLSDAKAAYARAVEIAPTNVGALERLGAYLDAVEDDHASAEPYLRRSVLAGGGPAAFALFARVLAELGRKKEALEWLDPSRCPYANTEIVRDTEQEIASGIWDPAG